jgi:hypothetical protein
MWQKKYVWYTSEIGSSGWIKQVAVKSVQHSLPLLSFDCALLHVAYYSCDTVQYK